jgi:hypothetical protein
MTDKTKTTESGVGTLDQVLDTFGADRTRWPAPVRRNFAGLLAESARARERLREAEALDRLLDLAPTPKVDTRALADRIMTATQGEPRVLPRAPITRNGRRSYDAGAVWPAAAMLAASLVIGVFVGLSGAFTGTVGTLVAASQYDAPENELDAGRIALDSESAGLFDGDYL